MIGKIVKEITKVNTEIYDILGDNVYPLQLPESDGLIIPSAIYSISDIVSNDTVKNHIINYNIAVSFRVITDKYSKLDDLVTVVIKGFMSANGDMNDKKINYIKLINSQDVFNNEEKLYGNDMIFSFNISLL